MSVQASNGRSCDAECGCAEPGEVHPVAAAAAAMLEQCAAFVRDVPGASYTQPSRTLQGGTIGKHVRHTLDHFRAALAGAAAEVIDYDHRERNVPMETEPREALAAIEALRRDLLGLTRTALSAPVRIRVMIAGDGTEAELGSTLARELAFAAHHAVHHHAMLGAIAAELGVEAGPEFGKAPSTITHERAQR
jgi:uncharacterized damage-inducible protein DinB